MTADDRFVDELLALGLSPDEIDPSKFWRAVEDVSCSSACALDCTAHLYQFGEPRPDIGGGES